MRSLLRLLRILLNTAAVVSLLLAVAVVALWVHGYAGRASVWHTAWSEDARWRSPVAAARGTGRLRGVEWGGGGIAVFQKSYGDRRVADLDGGTGWHFNRDEMDRAYPALDLPPGEDVGGLWRTSNRRWHGFQVARDASWVIVDGKEIRSETVHLVMPCWAWLAGFALMPTLRAASVVRRRYRVQRRRAGRCVYCSYDLRATPERCPECGRQAAAVVDEKFGPAR